MQLLSGPITIDTPLDPGVIHFRSMIAREVLGQPFLFDLDVFSKRSDIKPSELLGLPITVHLETVYFGTRHFSGLVARLEYRGTGNDYSNYRIVLRPWLWFLGHSVNSRVFQGKSASDIVKIIFREYREPPPGGEAPEGDDSKDKPEEDPTKRKVPRGIGLLTHFAESLSEKYLPLDYVVQYRETDLTFVTRIMERAGIYYYFKHYADKHELVLADSYSAHHSVPGYASIAYLPPDAHRHATIEYIDDWRLSGQALPGIHTHADYDFTRPGMPLLGAAPAPHPHAAASIEFYDYPGRFLENSDGDALATLRLQQLQAPYEVVLGASVARGLTTGCLFNLTDHPRPEQNKEHLVIATECELRGHDLTSGGDDGLTFRCAFEARDAHVPFRLPITTEKPVMRGPQTALVVGKDTEEIWTDEYGRVKVQFYWDREGMWDENSSCFIRVAQVWAGDGWGGMQIPRIGQEVIVDFLEGDPDQPIITGRVYNGDNMPPYTLTKFQNQSGIKSRSTKGGTPDNFNEIRFDDTKDAEDFHMQAEKDQTILVKHDQTTTVKANRTATITASDTVTVGGDRAMTVTGTRTATVKKKETQTFKAAREMTVKETNSDTITGAHTGTYHGGRTETVDKGDTLTVNASDKTVTVHGNYNTTADTQFKVVQGANTLLIKNSVDVDSEGEIHLHNPQCSVDLKDGKVTITAASELTLVCGSASISLKSNGAIEISGSQQIAVTGGTATLDLSAEGAAMAGTKCSVTGSAVTEISGAMVKIN